MMAPAGRKRHVLPKRWRSVIRIAVTAVVLAMVVIGVGIAADLLRTPSGGQAGVKNETAVKAAADYGAALTALASGDTTQGIALLQQAAEAGSTAAKAKLAEVSSGSGSTSTTTTKTIPATGYTAAVADMSTMLPATVEGYRLSEVETSSLGAIVSGEPTKVDANAPISRIEFSVYDRSTSAGAEAWVQALAKAFPKSASQVTIADVTGRFGTDGAKLASVAFSRGRFAFEVVATLWSGDPASQKALLAKVSATFPAAHAQ